MSQLKVTKFHRRFYDHYKPKKKEKVQQVHIHVRPDSVNFEANVFIDVKRQKNCLEGFSKLQEAKELCDVILEAGGKRISCHRALLATASDYFKAMFTSRLNESHQEVVTLPSLDAVTLEKIVEYLYKGKVKLSADTVQNLLMAANMMQLYDLKAGCAEFMSFDLDLENCIGVHFFANVMKCEALEARAWEMIVFFFNKGVSDCSEFLELPLDKLISIVKYDDLHANEKDVFFAICNWVDHDSTRIAEADQAMLQVRFVLCESEFLFDVVMQHKILEHCPNTRDLLMKVSMYKLMPQRWNESDLNYVPRQGNNVARAIVYTTYLDDVKQVVQLYGHRSGEVVGCRPGNILSETPDGIVNPVILATGDNTLYFAGDLWGGFFKFDSEELTFDELTPMPIGRIQFAMVEGDHKCIYCIGGYNENGIVSDVHKYSPVDGEWSLAAPLPTGLRGFCSVNYHGKIYIFGGEREITEGTRGKTEIIPCAYCFDPVEDKWTQLPDMPVKRALAGCVVYNDKIYVVGGFAEVTMAWICEKSPEGCIDTVHIFDPQTETWEEGPKLPLPLSAAGVVKYYGTVYVIGGETNKEISRHVYKLEFDQWVECEQMSTGYTEISVFSSYTVMNVNLGR